MKKQGMQAVMKVAGVGDWLMAPVNTVIGAPHMVRRVRDTHGAQKTWQAADDAVEDWMRKTEYYARTPEGADEPIDLKLLDDLISHRAKPRLDELYEDPSALADKLLRDLRRYNAGQYDEAAGLNHDWHYARRALDRNVDNLQRAGIPYAKDVGRTAVMGAGGLGAYHALKGE